jgi:hypothetical protein
MLWEKDVPKNWATWLQGDSNGHDSWLYCFIGQLDTLDFADLWEE